MLLTRIPKTRQFEWHFWSRYAEQYRLTVDTMPGIRTTGYFAPSPRAFMDSPTWNSLPSLLNFHNSGMLLRRRVHSISTLERSGRLISYWSASAATWECRSRGSTNANPTRIPTEAKVSLAVPTAIANHAQNKPNGKRKRRLNKRDGCGHNDIQI